MIFMFHIVLVNPEIPPNTGNIIRLAANLGAWLHLVAPLGFELEDRLLRRAGLNYHDKAGLQVHDSLAEALANKPLERSFAVTGGGETCFNAPAYNAGDVFVFGRESTGLSDAHRALFPPQRRLYIPMRPDNRSINLSNAVAIVAMEAWRQTGLQRGMTTAKQRFWIL